MEKEVCRFDLMDLCLNYYPSLFEAVKNKDIQHFITKGSIEPLDVSVLMMLTVSE